MNINVTTVAIVSLGCPKNQVDAELMLDKIAKAGYKLVVEPGEADVVIINTCCFIKSAKEEAIEEILEAAARKADGINKKIILTGCMAQRYQKELADELPEVDGIIGLGANDDIVSSIESVMGVTSNSTANNPPEHKHFAFDGEHNMEGERMLSTLPHYAYLRISDGCDNRCSYCAIPLFRGGYREREMSAIVEEATALVEKGVRELILVAQDVTAYKKLPKLLKNLAGIDKLKWIRLLYCYPQRISDELIQTIKEEDKILKYLDLPIQHCNDEILKSMNRQMTKSELLKLLGKLRQEIPEIVLRSTLITGFPSETPEQFEELAEFAHEVKFEHLGAFAYSEEEGTKAAEMPDQIDENERIRRCEIIVEQQEFRVSDWSTKLIGEEFEVVCEGADKYLTFDEQSDVENQNQIIMYFGRTYMHAPEIDGMVYFTAGDSVLTIGEFVTVQIIDVVDNNLIGVVINK
ncbi:MAG: 30S ribosomal protein S12 methylthiotransferase RimO [Oscillospiraceae bacterium]|nr:30S ribosomal protein S12 methylthiotransferase RimO [Oscillospiraceae bacterium]